MKEIKVDSGGEDLNDSKGMNASKGSQKGENVIVYPSPRGLTSPSINVLFVIKSTTSRRIISRRGEKMILFRLQLP